MYDIAIIGAGIVGGFLAYDLSKYKLKILILDKENDVANGTSMANSAIVHTGHDPEDNTLKAKLNVEGSRMYAEICRNLHLPYLKCGAYVVARNNEDIENLKILKSRALKRKISVEEVDQMTIRKTEKNISDDVICGLSFPDTAIIDPMLTTISLIEQSILSGSELYLNHEVVNITKNNTENFYLIKTANGHEFKSKMVINSAGLASDKIAEMIGNYDYKINYFRGEYFILDKIHKDFVSRVIYPTPSKVGKGVLALPTVHGNIMLGPTSDKVEFMNEINTSQAGLELVKKKLNYVVKDIPFKGVIRSFAGIRAKVDSKDFIITEDKTNKNFINLIGIDSPGIASAPAISKYVIKNFVEKSFCLESNPNFAFEVKVYPAIASQEDKESLIKQNSKYGKIICRCELISEQEIIDQIHRPLPATTIKGIKKRCRPGMGKCQGGFCQPLITKILSQELNVELNKINYDSNKSKVVLCAKEKLYDL